ncbi:MAG: 2'-5' RNA ligase family protein [Nitrospirota bacterium]
MGALAIDVVLLPSGDIMDHAISLNRALRRVSPAPIALSRTDCVPHVSLAMGCVVEETIPSLAQALTTLANSHQPVELTFTGVSVRSSQTGETVSSLEIARNPALQALHEAVMRATAPWFTHHATPEMFVDPASVTASTLGWVNEYPASASFDRFWPHITLGVGTVPEGVPLPAPGQAPRLALCHLGPRCTCRRIVFEVSLQDRK